MKLVLDDGSEFKIKDINVVDIKDGDVICLSIAQTLNIEQSHRLKDNLSKIFPSNKIVVLGEGMSLNVIREKDWLKK